MIHAMGRPSLANRLGVRCAAAVNDAPKMLFYRTKRGCLEVEEPLNKACGFSLFASVRRLVRTLQISLSVRLWRRQALAVLGTMRELWPGTPTVVAGLAEAGCVKARGQRPRLHPGRLGKASLPGTALGTVRELWLANAGRCSRPRRGRLREGPGSATPATPVLSPYNS
jgi:hypothetical protein